MIVYQIMNVVYAGTWRSIIVRMSTEIGVQKEIPQGSNAAFELYYWKALDVPHD